MAHRCLADSDIYLHIIDPPPELTNQGASFEIMMPVYVPRHLRALFIDDQRTWLDLVVQDVGKDETIDLDTRTSYDVVLEAAMGSREALSALGRFDLVLLDCHFTGRRYDGPELLERLQGIDPELARRIVLMSGEKEYLSRGDVRVLDKFSDVLEKLPHVLHELGSRRY